MTERRSAPARWKKSFAAGFDVDEMNAHIRAWADYLGLGSWHVAFSTAATDPDDRGSIDIDPLKKRAALRLASDMPLSQVDRTIVHELLHVLGSEMDDAFGLALKRLAPGEAEMLRATWKRGEEWMIERLVDVILPGTSRGEWEGSAVWTKAFPA